MQNYLIIQLGASGMAWLMFIVGLLWCSFAWWRSYRCKRAMACIISAITSLISGLLTIALLIGASIRPSTGINENMLEIIALGFFALMAISWTFSSIFFLLAAIKSQYPTPDELAAETPPPHPL